MSGQCDLSQALESLEHRQVLATVASMRAFAGDDPTFIYGWWLEWRREVRAGSKITPAEFKARKRAGAAS